MGNYRFRLSSVIPNSWLYKLKDSRKTSIKELTKPQTDKVDHRRSYYFTRDVTIPDTTICSKDSPPSPNLSRKSTKQKRPSTPNKPNHRRESVGTKSDSSDTELASPKLSHTCSCKTNSSYEDVYGKVDLPPIITKPPKQEEFRSVKPFRKVKANSYSPRIRNRVRIQRINGSRKSYGNRHRLCDSMVVAKTSVDPGKDFKESMMEMIVENNIKSSKDLEDLLACYLSLNSNEYHELIIEVFKQIWFESTHIRL